MHDWPQGNCSHSCHSHCDFLPCFRELGPAQQRYCSYFERVLYAPLPPKMPSRTILRRVVIGAIGAIAIPAFRSSSPTKQFTEQTKTLVSSLCCRRKRRTDFLVALLRFGYLTCSIRQTGVLFATVPALTLLPRSSSSICKASLSHATHSPLR